MQDRCEERGLIDEADVIVDVLDSLLLTPITPSCLGFLKHQPHIYPSNGIEVCFPLEIAMRTTLLALATVAASAALNVGAAQAQQYPFCLISGPGPGDCKYNTYEQCMATASGTGKYCQPNYWLPEFRGAPGAGYGYSPRVRGYAPGY